MPPSRCRGAQANRRHPAPSFLAFGGAWSTGSIAPFALIAEIFTDVRIYEFPNKGGWYDLGFMLGVSSWGGEAGRRSGRRKRKRKMEESDV